MFRILKSLFAKGDDDWIKDYDPNKDYSDRICPVCGTCKCHYCSCPGGPRGPKLPTGLDDESYRD